jgi:hypothetical protein
MCNRQELADLFGELFDASLRRELGEALAARIHELARRAEDHAYVLAQQRERLQ